jgi:hypothetical protein
MCLPSAIVIDHHPLLADDFANGGDHLLGFSTVLPIQVNQALAVRQ